MSMLAGIWPPEISHVVGVVLALTVAAATLVALAHVVRRRSAGAQDALAEFDPGAGLEVLDPFDRDEGDEGGTPRAADTVVDAEPAAGAPPAAPHGSRDDPADDAPVDVAVRALRAQVHTLEQALSSLEAGEHAGATSPEVLLAQLECAMRAVAESFEADLPAAEAAARLLALPRRLLAAPWDRVFLAEPPAVPHRLTVVPEMFGLGSTSLAAGAVAAPVADPAGTPSAGADDEGPDLAELASRRLEEAALREALHAAAAQVAAASAAEAAEDWETMEVRPVPPVEEEAPVKHRFWRRAAA